jgi:Mn-dependent DtxR family transcriptional regulator
MKKPNFTEEDKCCVFFYNINQLIEKGLIDKKNINYSMTEEGLEYSKKLFEMGCGIEENLAKALVDKFIVRSKQTKDSHKKLKEKVLILIL